MSARREAWNELLRRYRESFAYHWRHRHDLAGGGFGAAEAEFLPAALSLQEAPVSPTARLAARLLMALVAVALAGAVFGHMDIIVNASGKIIPSAHTKTIASVEVAGVRALHVTEGQAVKAGQVLVELDATATEAEHDKARAGEVSARLQAARARALIAALDGGSPPRLPSMADVPAERWLEAQAHLSGQYLDYRARLARLDGDIRRYQEALPLASRRAADYQALAQSHDVSQHAWLEKEQARVDLAGQLAEARNQKAALIAETRRAALDALAEGSRLAGDHAQDARRAAGRSRLLTLSAPVEGTVQQLAVHTVGGVVPAAQPLMEIVPKNSPVEVEAFMENKDVGFVREGQEAAVKVEAFEYTKYGTVPARVSHVSRDAIQDEKRGLIYSVKVALARSSLPVDGREVALAPGMAVGVEIKTGERRVIEYVLSPLVRHARESLNER